MIFLLGLIEAILFVIFCKGGIKKHPGVFYAIAVAIIAIIVAYDLLEVYNALPEWTWTYIFAPFYMGTFATALFMIVMFLGAVDKKAALARQLMPIRGNLAIFACIVTLAQSFAYGIYYVPALFTNPAEIGLQYMIALIITVPLFAIMIFLTVISFRKVRSRFKPATWKKLQKLSYVWFALLYIYLMILVAPTAWEALQPGCDWGLFWQINYILSFGSYNAVFLTYLIMRVGKYRRDKARRAVTAAEAAPVL